MKRIIATLLFVSLIVSFSACSLDMTHGNESISQSSDVSLEVVDNQPELLMKMESDAQTLTTVIDEWKNEFNSKIGENGLVVENKIYDVTIGNKCIFNELLYHANWIKSSSKESLQVINDEKNKFANLGDLIRGKGLDFGDSEFTQTIEGNTYRMVYGYYISDLDRKFMVRVLDKEDPDFNGVVLCEDMLLGFMYSSINYLDRKDWFDKKSHNTYTYDEFLSFYSSQLIYENISTTCGYCQQYIGMYLQGDETKDDSMTAYEFLNSQSEKIIYKPNDYFFDGNAFDQDLKIYCKSNENNEIETQVSDTYVDDSFIISADTTLSDIKSQCSIIE